MIQFRKFSKTLIFIFLPSALLEFWEGGGGVVGFFLFFFWVVFCCCFVLFCFALVVVVVVVWFGLFNFFFRLNNHVYRSFIIVSYIAALNFLAGIFVELWSIFQRSARSAVLQPWPLVVSRDLVLQLEIIL